MDTSKYKTGTKYQTKVTGKWYHEKCRKRESNANQKTNSSQSSQSSLNTGFDNLCSEPDIEIGIESIDSNDNNCIFKCDISVNLEVIPQNVITQVFVEKGIIIPNGSFACVSHFIDDNSEQINPEELVNLQSTRDISNLNAENIKTLLLSLRDKVLSHTHLNETIFDEMSEEELRETTGVSKGSFNKLKSHLNNLNLKRSASFALGIYLSQLKSDSTEKSLSMRYYLPQPTLHRYITKVRSVLYEKFVPQWLGFSDDMRSRIKDNTSFMAKGIHDKISSNNIITVWDATYIYCDKSAVDHELQKDSFSGHKRRNLIKPMVGCTTNGYIIDAFGPKEAKLLDSTILNELFEDKTTGFQSFFKKGDVFLLDKGFLNSKTLLEGYGMKVEVPLSSPFGNKSKHLTWELANNSRLVTKLRWVIECCFGSIKNRFKKFTHTWSTVGLNHVFEDFRIACAIHNMDFQRLESDKFDQLAILNQIKNTIKKPNRIQSLIIDENLNQRQSRFVKIDSAIFTDFPNISPIALRIFSVGSYQIKQAASYIASHLKNGKYFIQVAKENVLDYSKYQINIESQNALLIKGQIMSRHSGPKSNKKYQVYVLFDKTKRDVDSIIEHYCGCVSGARTVGCCSHVMTIIWYLSHGRHLPFKNSRLRDIFNRQIELVPIESDDEDENDDQNINIPSTSQSKRQKI